MHITEAATGDYARVELQINTAHPNGTFTPKVNPKECQRDGGFQ